MLREKFRPKEKRVGRQEAMTNFDRHLNQAFSGNSGSRVYKIGDCWRFSVFHLAGTSDLDKGSIHREQTQANASKRKPEDNYDPARRQRFLVLVL